MARAGAPLRAIQEWVGHADYRTTSIFADYAPDPSGGARYAAIAFGDAPEGETLDAALAVQARDRARPDPSWRPAGAVGGDL